MTAVRCSARSKSTGDQCGKLVTPPATVCFIHGGRAPRTLAKVERQRQEAALERAVQTYGGPVDKPAADVLAEMIAAAYGHVLWLGALIASSPDLESVPELVLNRYDAERNLLAKMNRDYLGAGIAERQQQLAERTGTRLAGVLRDVLGDVFGLLAEAGLSVDVLVQIQREAVPGVVRRRLSEVMEVSP